MLCIEEVNFNPFSFMEKPRINWKRSAYHLHENYRGGEDFSIIGRYKTIDLNLAIREASLPLKYLDKFVPLLPSPAWVWGWSFQNIILSFIDQPLPVWGGSLGETPLLAQESLTNVPFLWGWENPKGGLESCSKELLAFPLQALKLINEFWS